MTLTCRRRLYHRQHAPLPHYPPAEYTEKKNKPWALKTKLRQSGEIMMKRAAARAMRTGAGLTDETAEFDDDDDDEQLPAQ